MSVVEVLHCSGPPRLEGVDEALQGIEHSRQEHLTLQLLQASVVLLVVLPHCVVEAAGGVTVAQVNATA